MISDRENAHPQIEREKRLKGSRNEKKWGAAFSIHTTV